MSISQLSFSNKSTPSRQALNREENYGLAVQRAFRELGQTALDKQRAELQLLEDLRLAQRRETEALQRRKAAEVGNAQDLKIQMALRRERLYREKLEEQVPGISLDYCGYPNLPETPDYLRQQLKAERQREMKAILDLQWDSQIAARRSDKVSDLQLERQLLDQAQRELNSLENQKAQKRARDRDELTKAWGEMERAKAIRERIESMHLKGINPRLEPINTFLVRAGGLQSASVEAKPGFHIEFDGKVPPQPEDPEKPLEEDEAPSPPAPEIDTSLQAPAPPQAAKDKDMHSQSFDLKTQSVRPPIIQQYQAHDTNHQSHIKGLRPSLRALGVARHSSQRTGTVPQAPSDSHRGNGWTFATNQEIESTALPASGRSHSQVVQPAVYVVRKFQRDGGRVLAHTGAQTLRRKL